VPKQIRSLHPIESLKPRSGSRDHHLGARIAKSAKGQALWGVCRPLGRPRSPLWPENRLHPTECRGTKARTGGKAAAATQTCLVDPDKAPDRGPRSRPREQHWHGKSDGDVNPAHPGPYGFGIPISEVRKTQGFGRLLSSDCSGSAAYRVQIEHDAPVLPNPPLDQSRTAMPEVNDFKGPTSGMGQRVILTTRTLPVYPKEQTFSDSVVTSQRCKLGNRDGSFD
jgi:hypothetical protein